MADIKRYGVGVGNGVELYTSDEPYFHEIDNRPLKNLLENEEKINAELESDYFKTPTGIKNGINNVFLFPYGERAIPKTVSVWLNGIKYRKNNILVNSNKTGFSIVNEDILPGFSDEFEVKYKIYDFRPTHSFEDFIEYTDISGDKTIIQAIGTGDGSQTYFKTNTSSPSHLDEVVNTMKFNEFSLSALVDDGSPTGITEIFTAESSSNHIHTLVSNISGGSGAGTWNDLSNEIEITFSYVVKSDANKNIFVIKTSEENYV